jgi:L-phenylalanine/L-methionine N-acetyltransferase
MSNDTQTAGPGGDRPVFIIRRAEPEDYEALHRIYAGPKVIAGTLQMPFPSLEFHRKRLATPDDDRYNLLACVDGEVIGHLGLYATSRPRRRHTAEFGMSVRDDWQGKGAGSALLQAAVDLAERWLNVSRLELQVYTDNAPAIALYKKFGFEIEGTLRKMAFRDGAYVDAYAMARLRAEG